MLWNADLYSANGRRKAQRPLKGYSPPQLKILTPAQAAESTRSIRRVLERVAAERDQRRVPSGTTCVSLTLDAARELERYLNDEKTEICDRRMAEVYFRVLCVGLNLLPWLDRDLMGRVHGEAFGNAAGSYP